MEELTRKVLFEKCDKSIKALSMVDSIISKVEQLQDSLDKQNKLRTLGLAKDSLKLFCLVKEFVKK